MATPDFATSISSYPFAVITFNILSQSHHELRVSQKFYEATPPTTLSPHSDTLNYSVTIRVFKALQHGENRGGIVVRLRPCEVLSSAAQKYTW